MTRDESTPTKPDAGVIATSPATAPVAKPRAVGFLRTSHSSATHVSAAMAVAQWVATKADPARPFEATADPALKPNHPNHRSAVPINVMGRLCGLRSSDGSVRRFP